jgi:hypothetical protein
MSSGFNTDVRVGEQIFHVQTEDRGPSRPIIDTAVYQNGRVLHRRSSNYGQFAASDDFNMDALRQRVEEQHRSVIESLRSGVLDADIAAATEQASRTVGIQVQLLNTGSWLTAGTVSLEVEVVRRSERQPETGAQVEAVIEGAIQETRHTAITNDQGRVKILFPLPPLGRGDLALVIRAAAGEEKDEIRFSMRTRAKATQAGPAQ